MAPLLRKRAGRLLIDRSVSHLGSNVSPPSPAAPLHPPPHPSSPLLHRFIEKQKGQFSPSICRRRSLHLPAPHAVPAGRQKAHPALVAMAMDTSPTWGVYFKSALLDGVVYWCAETAALVHRRPNLPQTPRGRTTPPHRPRRADAHQREDEGTKRDQGRRPRPPATQLHAENELAVLPLAAESGRSWRPVWGGGGTGPTVVWIHQGGVPLSLVGRLAC